MEVVVVAAGFREISGDFFGPGAPWLADRLPDLVGADDDASGFRPPKPMLQTWRRHAGLRTPRTQVVFETLVPVVLAQKVTGLEAAQGYRRLLRRYGEPIGEDRSPPCWCRRRRGSGPRCRAGVAPRRVGPERARTVIAAARRAAALERLTQLAPDVAREKLQGGARARALDGGGGGAALLGDADAFSWGDYHAAKDVVSRPDGPSRRFRRGGSRTTGRSGRPPVPRAAPGRGWAAGTTALGPRYTRLDHRRR